MGALSPLPQADVEDLDDLAARFPAGFTFGVASSAYQIEGALHEDGRGQGIWEPFCATPGKIAGGADASLACDHYHRWEDDLLLMAELGIRAYRFSTSWCRIIPDGIGSVNARGLDFYERLVERMLELDIEPWLTLFHWDLPQRLEDQSGWYSRRTADEFERYVDAVVRRLGDRVTNWITHNEPWCTAWLGYATGVHAPGKEDGIPGAVRAAHNILVSHGKAVEVIRSQRPGARVGIAPDFYPTSPASGSTSDRQAAEIYDGLRNRWFLDAVTRASYPTLWPAQEDWLPAGFQDDLRRIQVPLDFIGVNYYQRQIVAADPMTGEPVIVDPDSDDYTDGGREVFPNGLEELLLRLHRDYPAARFVITENGAGYADQLNSLGRIQDERRISFLRRHLSALGDALAGGVPVDAYFVWTIMDNFEWAEGYQDAYRFGLVHVDFETQRRLPKASAHWYADLIATHRATG